MDHYQEMQLAVIRIRHSVRVRTDGRYIEKDGGPGSGNWGHRGRKGKVGGSEKGGGGHNRQSVKEGSFTSFAKKKKDMAKEHILTQKEVDHLNELCRDHECIIIKDGKHYAQKYVSKLDEGMKGLIKGECKETEEEVTFGAGDSVRVILPNSMDPNYSLSKSDKDAIGINRKRFEGAFSAKDGYEADRKLRKQAGEVWGSLEESEKTALFSYTEEEFYTINSALRKGDTEEEQKPISNITSAINKSELQEDMVLSRGISDYGAERLFGLPEGYIKNMDTANMSLLGRIGTEKGFMSTGAAKGGGFSAITPVQLEILAPKGTKALYCEPFSANGEGEGRYWNGISPQKYISEECEVLVQRDTTLQIVGFKKSPDGKILIQAAIVDQKDFGGGEPDKKTA